MCVCQKYKRRRKRILQAINITIIDPWRLEKLKKWIFLCFPLTKFITILQHNYNIILIFINNLFLNDVHARLNGWKMENSSVWKPEKMCLFSLRNFKCYCNDGMFELENVKKNLRKKCRYTHTHVKNCLEDDKK